MLLLALLLLFSLTFSYNARAAPAETTEQSVDAAKILPPFDEDVYTVVVKGQDSKKLLKLAEEIELKHQDEQQPSFRARVKTIMQNVRMLNIKKPSEAALVELRQHPNVIGVFPNQRTWSTTLPTTSNDSDIQDATLAAASSANSIDTTHANITLPRMGSVLESVNKTDQKDGTNARRPTHYRTLRHGSSSSHTAVSPLSYCSDELYQWGLDRIDQRENILDCKQYDAQSYTNYGANVDVYVFDTGIQLNHAEFEGGGSRAVKLAWDFYSTGSSSNNDLTGHGTHVASTVAGKSVGVARKAGIYSVKVLDQNGGTTADLIEAIDLLIAKKQSKKKRRMIANMSLSTSYNGAVNAAVKRLTDARVPVVASAGNNGADACNYSPASEPSAITVGAYEQGGSLDTRYSNFGSCVDIAAPGSEIIAAASSTSSNSSYNVRSGTSMAAPHVTGILALHMSQAEFPGYSKNPSAARIHALLRCTASAGKMNQVPADTPNLLVWRPHKSYGAELTACVEVGTADGI